MRTNAPTGAATRTGLAIIVAAAAVVVLAGWLWPRGGSADDSGRQASAQDSAASGVAHSELASSESESGWTASEPEDEPGQVVWKSEETLPDGTKVQYEATGPKPPVTEIRHEELPDHMTDFMKVVDDYFAASEEDRVALLDKHIDEMMAFNEKFMAGGGTMDFEVEEEPGRKTKKITVRADDEGGNKKIKIDGVNDAEMKQMERNYLEAGDPVMRARLSEFSRALSERMKERGMDGTMVMMAFQEEEKK
jgi:hypothetical protein